MEEMHEQESSERLDVQHYLQIVRRRYVQFLVIAFLGWLVVWSVSWVVPLHYKSSTLILVEQPTMPKNYVMPNINDDLQNRLQSIKQQILSRTRLLLIIDKLHLYSDSSQRRITPEERVERMAKDIDVELVHDSQGNQITAFKISYSAPNPKIAQQVTNELSNLFITENLKVRQQQSEDTTNFIGGHLEIARTNLAEQEARVREFKGKHEGELPSQEASNLQILSGLQSQLQNEQDNLNAAKQQRIYLQTLIEQYRAAHPTTRTGDGSPTSLTAIDQDLVRLKAKLADLSSRYTDRYPEIENLKDQIANAEKARAALVAELKTAGNRERSVEDATTVSDPALLQLQSQLQANQAEIANRDQAIAVLKAKMGSYQDRLGNEPAREQELADLTRDYEQSKANYDDLLRKRNESEMATSMEQMQQGERFSILDPPGLPQKPAFPNRLQFSGIGVGVGLVLGLLFVVASEALDNRLHSEKEIAGLLPVAVISEIPEIVSLSDERGGKRKLVFGWTMASLAIAMILAGSALSYLHG